MQERYHNYISRKLKEERTMTEASRSVWVTFRKEYDGKKVQDTGMTHQEFLRYMEDGYREGDEHDTGKKLRAFLAGLGL